MALLGRADNPPGYSPGPPNPFVDTPAPTATATVALPDSGAAVPDTRVNWSTYGAPSRERLDTDVYGGTTAGGYSGGGYPTIGRPLRDDEVPFNPSPGSPSGAAAAASPSDLYPGENPWAGEGRSAAATSASASASGTSLANVYDSRSNVAGSSSGDPYGRPYWDAGTGSNNIYAVGLCPEICLMRFI